MKICSTSENTSKEKITHNIKEKKMTETPKKTTRDKCRKANNPCLRIKAECVCSRGKRYGQCGRCNRREAQWAHFEFLKQDDREPETPLTDLEKHKRDCEYLPCFCGGSYTRLKKLNHFSSYQHARCVSDLDDEFTDEEDEDVPRYKPFLKPDGGVAWRGIFS